MTESVMQRLERNSITIEAESDEDGRLRRPVTAREIVKSIADTLQIGFAEHEIKIEFPITELGLYNVPVSTRYGWATLKVWVVPPTAQIGYNEPIKAERKLDQSSNRFVNQRSGCAPGLTLIDLRHRKGVAPGLK
jgi:hypothetical protein